jgi:hypothetical protein
MRRQVMRAWPTVLRSPGQRRGKTAAVARGAALFNGGLFFECHEYFEGLWRAAPAADRDFYQGLILVAAGFYHLEKGNVHGAGVKLGAGMHRLSACAPAYGGLDLARWLRALEPRRARVQAGALGVLDPAEIPAVAPAARRGQEGRGPGQNVL